MDFSFSKTLVLSLGLVPAAVSAQTVTQIPVTEVQTGMPAGMGATQGGYAQSAQSELVLMVQQLQQEVRQLRGELENQQYRLQKMEQEQRDRYRDIDRRVSALITATADDAGLTPLASSDPAPAPQSQDPLPASTSAPAAAAAPAGSASDDQAAYQQAFAYVRARQFDEGLQAFQSFIQDYPSSSNVANAWYWIGEIHLAQRNLPAALSDFEKVVDGYPRHNKVPDALYKLGVVNQQLGNARASAAAFQRVIAEYPQSSAAGLARNFSAR